MKTTKHIHFVYVYTLFRKGRMVNVESVDTPLDPGVFR